MIINDTVRHFKYLKERHFVYFEGHLNLLKYKDKYNNISEADSIFVPKGVIRKYDKKIEERVSAKILNSEVFSNEYTMRSIFIENCYYEPNYLNKYELRVHLFKNFIYYAWWDLMDYPSFIKTLYNFYFARSTRAFIDLDMTILYFKDVFQTKQLLFDNIFEFFDFPDNYLGNQENSSLINYNCAIESDTIQLDYNYRVKSHLIKAVRNFENELRGYF